jgi:twinkle protein
MSYEDYGIIIPNGKYTGQVYTTCPKCSHTRKKNKDKCLGINLTEQYWHCSHCNWKGRLPKEIFIEEKVYVKPVWKNKTELSQKAVKWFESRSLNQQTLIDFQISEGIEWMPQTQKEENTIQFNYFDEENELTNIKYRDGAKNFKLFKDGKLIFYGLTKNELNRFSFYEDAFLCEGEIDCLSIYQSGFKNVLSVPNGANIKTNNLEYFDRVAHKFAETPLIYLCFDNDNAGRRLLDEFADRLGKERCKIVTFKDCKDANECLQKYGIQGIIESISEAKEFPLEGVFTIEDMVDEISDMYENGLEKGVNIGHQTFDKCLTFVKGYITTVTGIPGHGKSEFVDEIVLRLNINHGWRCAFYSPENKPTKLHFSKLARKIIGKSWDSGFDNRMTYLEVQMVQKALNNNIWFVKPEKDFSLESILEHVKQLKLKHGIDCFVIDAWNKLEHKYGVSETKYIGESLDKLANFCELYNVHCFLVAHPRKIAKDKQSGKYEIPTLYDVAGSANFFNKSDNGISVYRDEENKTWIHVQKVKFSHWGQIGHSTFTYHKPSGRYIEDGGFYHAGSWVSLASEPLQENTNFLEQTNNNEDPF